MLSRRELLQRGAAIAAPVALAWGLQHTSGVVASLLLSLEAVFTVLLARAIWSEPIGVRVAKLMVRPMFRAFFGGIPEAPLLFDTRQMRQDAEAFDYSTISPEVLDVSWVPSYCTRP